MNGTTRLTCSPTLRMYVCFKWRGMRILGGSARHKFHNLLHHLQYNAVSTNVIDLLSSKAFAGTFKRNNSQRTLCLYCSLHTSVLSSAQFRYEHYFSYELVPKSEKKIRALHFLLLKTGAAVDVAHRRPL